MLVWQLVVNGIIAGSMYALIALGFGLIYRTVRFFHFAHGAVYAVGAYLAYTFLDVMALPPALGFFLPSPWPRSLASPLTA